MDGDGSSPGDAAADDGAEALVLRPRQELAHHLSGLLLLHFFCRPLSVAARKYDASACALATLYV
jgi:hypothetical protein